jgi:hypothetical protein
MLLRFPKEMSHSGILALGLAKEGLHQLGQFLDATHRADRQPLHLVLGLYQPFRNAALHMRPDLLIGVQVRRIWRQVEERDTVKSGV